MTTAATASRGLAPRLTFGVATENASPNRTVSGAWHPRTNDLEVELPELISAVEKKTGPIERILFNLDEWRPTSQYISVARGKVRLNGYRFQPPHTVSIRTRSGWRLELLVIPPLTDVAVAQVVLRSALQQGGTETVQQLLGLTLTDTAPFTEPAVAEQRWDTDGGSNDKDEFQ